MDQTIKKSTHTDEENKLSCALQRFLYCSPEIKCADKIIMGYKVTIFSELLFTSIVQTFLYLYFVFFLHLPFSIWCTTSDCSCWIPKWYGLNCRFCVFGHHRWCEIFKAMNFSCHMLWKQSLLCNIHNCEWNSLDT